MRRRDFSPGFEVKHGLQSRKVHSEGRDVDQVSLIYLRPKHVVL